jgi:hypothetical protein
MYLGVFLCIIGALQDQKIWVFGGAFDISAFLQTIKKKYKPTQKSSVEVEIKLSRQDLFDKIVKWIRRQKYIESDTTNKIWPHDGLINTIYADGTNKLSRKKRLTKYELPIGKLTVALEISEVNMAIPTAEPILVRQKKRISAPLNKYWRIDCTWVNGAQIPEVEIEYIASDYWNSLQHIPEIERFLMSLT